MQGFRRILVAVKTPGRRITAAIAKGAQLAKASGASLELFHALSTPIQIDPLAYAGRGALDAKRKIKAQALAELEMAARQVRSAGVRVTTAAEWDFPVYESIVRRALRSRADLLVAEPHAGRRLAPWLLHLNDWELLRLSPVPVLLVKRSGRYRHPAVLAALDPKHASAKTASLDREIVRVAGGVADCLRGRLHAMHAHLPAPSVGLAGYVMSSAVGRMEMDYETLARRAFGRALGKAKIPASRQHLVRQLPMQAIPAVARRVRAQIVAMGAVSRSGLGRVLIGNTAERVLDELPCDVLVVKALRFRCPVERARQGARVVFTPSLPTL